MTRKNTIAWMAILLSASFASLWAFWGALENFHEGWYYTSLRDNLMMMVFQYWLFALLFIALGGIAIYKPKIGAILFIITGMLIPLLKIKSFAAVFIFSLPLVITGILFWFGNPDSKKWAYRIAVLLPLSLLCIFSIEPAWRTAQRVDDKNYGERLVEGNDVSLYWAPEGPGWPTETISLTYKSWDEINNICARLRIDGQTISDTAVNLWRLPTIEEAVRSLPRNGNNAGGQWNQELQKASYNKMPDKESPLWKVHSPIIYYWTATEVNDSMVYRIVYNGSIQPVKKNLRMGSLGFRAVRDKIQ